MCKQVRIKHEMISQIYMSAFGYREYQSVHKIVFGISTTAKIIHAINFSHTSPQQMYRKQTNCFL